MGGEYRLFYLFLLGFLIVLAALWFLLPFAIFGTKDKLQTLIDETVATKKAVIDLTETLKSKIS
jgi:hypothetical protein